MAAATGNVIVIENDSHFLSEMTKAGAKLVVVDFMAVWCGPCKNIAPTFSKLSTEYSAAVFLKVDVDKCEDIAARYGVSSMPTFLFFKGKVKVDEMSGADPKKLKEKIIKWIGDSDSDVGVKGHMDLGTFINKSGCECLNESDDYHLPAALAKGPDYLESDCDEQLLVTIAFNQAVKLHSLKIQGPDDGRGPKTVKLFTNHPNSMDFDSAENFQAVQTLELTPDDIKDDVITPLKFVKFQNVNSLTLFFQNNQGGEETTVLEYIGFIGSPLDSTNMEEFKRVAGKKGDRH
ncbi:thioredoxin-like protein 1 isoform X2 [Orbicella faveolata]|uniref:thioredoxin-like protein 1 isoform X2 n=1 Tax=Orbicella faveolata TaxID=48498 RepID=UPI0009E28553|nr:thioredoxin-like protein 1 isoform X2 [Orbicella faveolata]